MDPFPKIAKVFAMLGEITTGAGQTPQPYRLTVETKFCLDELEKNTPAFVLAGWPRRWMALQSRAQLGEYPGISPGSHARWLPRRAAALCQESQSVGGNPYSSAPQHRYGSSLTRRTTLQSGPPA